MRNVLTWDGTLSFRPLSSQLTGEDLTSWIARSIVCFLITEQDCEVVRRQLPGARKKILARGGGKERLSTSITIVILTLTCPLSLEARCPNCAPHKKKSFSFQKLALPFRRL